MNQNKLYFPFLGPDHQAVKIVEPYNITYAFLPPNTLNNAIYSIIFLFHFIAFAVLYSSPYFPGKSHGVGLPDRDWVLPDVPGRYSDGDLPERLVQPRERARDPLPRRHVSPLTIFTSFYHSVSLCFLNLDPRILFRAA